jgi:hypothetical protein
MENDILIPWNWQARCVLRGCICLLYWHYQQEKLKLSLFKVTNGFLLSKQLWCCLSSLYVILLWETRHYFLLFFIYNFLICHCLTWEKNRILLRKQKENWLLAYNVLGGKLDLLLSIRMSMFIFESLCLFWFKTSLTTVHLGLMTKLSNHAHVMKRYCFVTWLRWWNIEMTRKKWRCCYTHLWWTFQGLCRHQWFELPLVSWHPRQPRK